MRRLIAIDPGANGAVAFTCEDSTAIDSLGETDRDTCDAFRDLRDADPCRVFAWLENVGGYRPGNSGPAAAKFARSVGKLEGMLIALNIPFGRVPPQTWMKALGTLPKEKKDRKNKIKALMQERYPHLKVTLKNADALGILTWALQNERSE